MVSLVPHPIFFESQTKPVMWATLHRHYAKDGLLLSEWLCCCCCCCCCWCPCSCPPSCSCSSCRCTWSISSPSKAYPSRMAFSNSQIPARLHSHLFWRMVQWSRTHGFLSVAMRPSVASAEFPTSKGWKAVYHSAVWGEAMKIPWKVGLLRYYTSLPYG